MDDDELEKGEDTQTSTDNTKESSDNVKEETTQNTNKEENTEEQKEDAKEQDDEVANAFGNKSENKNEGDKGKKANTVAKKNDDGSITFKNQEELNGFIDRMVAKGAKKAGTEAQSNKNETEKEEKKNTEEQKDIENNRADQNISSIPNFTADIALSMIEAGADSKKARRAARLVDTNKIVVNGQLDEAKLKEEVDSILSDFPEFKSSQATEDTEKGFKFGAGKQAYTDSNEDLISGIFGNNK